MSDNENNERKPVSYSFKFDNEVLKYLATLLEANLDENTKDGDSIPIDVQLSVALEFLTSGNYKTESGIPESSLYECIDNVIDSLISVAPMCIKFPSKEEFPDVKKQFMSLGIASNTKVGFPDAIGVIDCDYIRLQQPEENEELYKNHKSEYCINVQFVCGPNLEFYNVFAAFPGSFQNSIVWKNSLLRELLEEHNYENSWLLGNLNYLQEPWLMTPIKDCSSSSEKLYNYAHKTTHRIVRRSLNMLKNRFQCLNTILNYPPAKLCPIVVACCVLHNICLGLEDFKTDLHVEETDKCFSDEIESLEEGLRIRELLVKEAFDNAKKETTPESNEETKH